MSFANNLLLAVNPGSTSTKVALYEGAIVRVEESLHHSTADLQGFDHYQDQLEFRITLVEGFLTRQGVSARELAATVGRGGLLKPLRSGTYRVNTDMLNDLRLGVYGVHASNLGGQIAFALADPYGIPAFIVDPVSVDEFCDQARFSGLPDLPRQSMVHALNTRAIAHRHASAVNLSFDELNVVVAHLGGGLSIVPICQGRMIDVNNANQAGPMSPERAGSLPSYDLVRLCFSGKYTEAQLLKLVAGNGGLTAHLGTNDLRLAEERAADGEDIADRVLEAMYYQIGKEIGAMAAVLQGKCNAILLTGGMAFSNRLVAKVSEYVSWIAPVYCYPGEEELRALCEGAWRALQGLEKVNEY